MLGILLSSMIIGSTVFLQPFEKHPTRWTFSKCLSYRVQFSLLKDNLYLNLLDHHQISIR